MHSNENGTIITSNGYYIKAKNAFQPSSTSHQISTSLPSHTIMEIPPTQGEPDIRYTKVSTIAEPPRNVDPLKGTELRGQKWNIKSSEAVAFLSPSTNGENCRHDLSLKRDKRTKCEKCALYSGFIGLTFILSAIVW